MSGEIPAELGTLSNLTDLRLDGNNLSGEIPAELGNLSYDNNGFLSRLTLQGNDFTGCVPSSLEDQLVAPSDIGDLPFC